jgi:hypothetical protein
MIRFLVVLIGMLGLICQLTAEEILKDPTKVDPRLKKTWKQVGQQQKTQNTQPAKPVLKGRILSDTNSLVLIEFSGETFMLKQGGSFTAGSWGKVTIKKITSTQVTLDVPATKKEWILQ